jgi:hypothetical protein
MRKPPRYSPQTFQTTCHNEMKHSRALRETIATATSERTPTTTIYVRRTSLFMTTDNGCHTHVKTRAAKQQMPRVASLAETTGFVSASDVDGYGGLEGTLLYSCHSDRDRPIRSREQEIFHHVTLLKSQTIVSTPCCKPPC